MHWGQALVAVVSWFIPVAFALFVMIRIASKAGFSTGMAILFGISIPIGLIYMAFADWPVEERLRALQGHRILTKARRRADRGVPESTDAS